MQARVRAQLEEELNEELAKSSSSRFAIIGHTADAYEILTIFEARGAKHRLLGIYDDGCGIEEGVQPLSGLKADQPDTVIIADDAGKEDLLLAAMPHLEASTRVIIGGYEHLAFRDPLFEEVIRTALVPSLANGYPHSLIHIYECLCNAARLRLDGVVVEFGVFKGGTTMVMSRLIERLGQSWKVIGFDTFEGFPPKRSLLDMYEHPDCVFDDEDTVRRYLSGRDIELVRGDVVETIERLANENIVLAFFDTDNFTPTAAILDAIQESVVRGGALIFDHFTGIDRFKYTLGERLAAKRLLDDERYFHLHGTGVFLRQQ